MPSQHYRQILKTSTITGISRAISLLAGFARTKIISVYTGTSGVGTLALYSSAISLIGSLSSMGLGSSAIKSIAQSANDPDASKVAEIILSLRRLCWMTGILGATCCAIFSSFISQLTFGSGEHATSIALLSVTILLGQLSAGQTALLRGLRQVRQLASGTVWSSLASIGLAAAWIMPLGAAGIIPFVISLAIANLVGTWWFARSVSLPEVDATWGDSLRRGRSMLSLGLAFLVSGGMTTLTSYLIGLILVRTDGTHLNGLYQAAWSCSGALVSFVLVAMSQDFYPRLAAAVDKPDDVKQIIDSQVEVGVLLALPCMVALSGLAFCIFPILFTKDFEPASKALPWFLLGSFGRVISWPMGFYLIAAGKKRWYIATEFAANAFHLAAVFLLVDGFGVVGSGVAFGLLYVFYTALLLVVLKHLAGYIPCADAVKFGLFGYAAIIIAALVWPIAAAFLAGVTLILCLRTLVKKIGTDAPLVRRLIGLPVIGRVLS